MSDIRGMSAFLSRRAFVQRGTAVGATLAVITAAGSRSAGATQATPRAVAGYARPDSLVSAGWLLDNIDREDLVIVALMPESDFAPSHIPGSQQIDWPSLEIVDTSDLGIDSWQSQIAAAIGQLGITPDSAVVVYDDGTLFAARLWWVLHYLGHGDVRVLDGGLAAWKAAGGEVVEGQAVRNPVGTYDGTPNPAVLATYTEVLQSLEDPGVTIVDARSHAEYVEGHIPGAVNVLYLDVARPDPPLYWKAADELLSMFAAAGVDGDKRVIPYCFSGVKSAVTFFTLHLVGYDDVALYTGSWNEWSMMPGAPIEVGDN
ncbi:MAG TPA: sulfurtransferase [Thermomicrobiales bacterium]|nr:sulfurtransferase [Thermomicrobiales bacterium]